MIFIVRVADGGPPALAVKLVRRTPEVVSAGAGSTDYFCVGDPEAARSAGHRVVTVHDGWYADDQGGGVAVWGQGLYWEVRETPFRVKEACGAADRAAPEADADTVNVRAAIFQG